MNKENLEEHREQLIRDERVRQMIRVRAYEIYQMRGPQPGSQAQDWLQAENEVLAFLIADESRRIENDSPSNPSATVPPAAKEKAPSRKKPSSRTASPRKPSSKRGTSKKPADTKSKPARKRSTPKDAE
jgi:hypothetical protein